MGDAPIFISTGADAAMATEVSSASGRGPQRAEQNSVLFLHFSSQTIIAELYQGRTRLGFCTMNTDFFKVEINNLA